MTDLAGFKSAATGLAPTHLTSQSLVDLAYEDLQLAIASGALAEGERLVIDGLARKYGMSLIPIREALVRLSAERFVTFERNKGYRVAAKPTELEMKHLFQARLIMEVGAIEHGFANVNGEFLARLKAVNTALAEVGPARTKATYRRFIELNEQFHVLLIAALGNPFVVDAYNRLGYHQRVIQTQFRRGVPDGKRIVAEHAEVIAALEAGDKPKAIASMHDHIVGGYRRFATNPA